MIKERPCKRCGKQTKQEVCRRVTQSSAEFYGWWCLDCNWWQPQANGGQWIAKEQLVGFGVYIATLRTAEFAFGERCARCGQRGAELHHWGPRGIFGKDEAEGWPKDYLCKSCHDLWHEKVTPQLTT